MTYRKSYGKYTYAGYEKKDPKRDKNSFRVKSPVRSFRDLEVYQQTTLLSSKVFRLRREFEEAVSPVKIIYDQSAAPDAPGPVSGAPKKASLLEEWDILQKASREIPMRITQSYSEKFTDLTCALARLEAAAGTIALMTSRFDFILACLDAGDSANRSLREEIQSIITGYGRQKIKIINLKKAWARVFARHEPKKDGV